MIERKLYKIRRSQSGPSKRTVYRLTVPPDIARDLDPEMQFAVELTEDGLLYRPVTERPQRPSWAKKSAS